MRVLGDINFTKGMLLIQELDIEPPLPDIIDDYTTSVTMGNISSTDKSIYKNKKDLSRKSKEVTLK